MGLRKVVAVTAIAFIALQPHHPTAADNQRVPIVFTGQGVTRGEYPRSVTPADVAPPLAALSGIKRPHAEGRALFKSAVK